MQNWTALGFGVLGFRVKGRRGVEKSVKMVEGKYHRASHRHAQRSRPATCSALPKGVPQGTFQAGIEQARQQQSVWGARRSRIQNPEKLWPQQRRRRRTRPNFGVGAGRWQPRRRRWHPAAVAPAAGWLGGRGSRRCCSGGGGGGGRPRDTLDASWDRWWARAWQQGRRVA